MDWSLIVLVRKLGGVIDWMVCVAAALVFYQLFDLLRPGCTRWFQHLDGGSVLLLPAFV